MKLARSRRERGTISLVALCFVTVLSLALGSYLAVCSRAMNLSHRSFQNGLAQQLAEFGLEEGLRAFNRNDWSDWTDGGVSVDWDATTYALGKRAIASITFPADKFGQGTTARVRVRIDNFDAAVLGAEWRDSVNYRIGDLVGRNGIWFRCVKAHSSGGLNSPNLDPGDFTFWVPEPVPWAWRTGKSYLKDVDVVCQNGQWYRCIANTATAPPNVSYWDEMPAPQLKMRFPQSYATGQFVYRTSDDTWYRYNVTSPSAPESSFDGSHWDPASGPSAGAPYLRWGYVPLLQYRFNDVVYYNERWYRFIADSASIGVLPGSDPATWENALTGKAVGWRSGYRYNLGDEVYHGSSGQWYRCILEHTSGTITPSDPTHWANLPRASLAWSATQTYSLNHLVRHNGTWYLSLALNNLGHSPSDPASSTYWVGADTTDPTYRWSPTASNSIGSYRCYGGVWFRCLVTNLGRPPNDPAYWTATWTGPTGISSGGTVIYAEAILSSPNNPDVQVQLRAAVNPAPLFPNAAGALSDLTVVGGTGVVDSYDSSLGTSYTTQRSDIAVSPFTNFRATLASRSGLAILGNTTVRGYLAWPSPPANLSTDTTVIGPTSPSSPKVDPARVSRSAFVPSFAPRPYGGLTEAFAANDFPRGTRLPSGEAVLHLGTPGGTVPTIYYIDGNLEISSSSSIHELHIDGPVVLNVNGVLRLGGGGLIDINSTGSLELHVASQLVFETGTAGIRNRSPSSSLPDPKRLIIICDTTSSLTQGVGEMLNFYGTIYAPNTTATAGVSVATNIELFGALAARKVTFSAEANLHYDTSLRNAFFRGVDQPWTVTDWRLLPNAERATMP